MTEYIMALTLLVVSNLYFIFLYISYKTKLQKQILKSIQLYLDNKLIDRLISTFSYNSQKAKDKILSSIKQYFYLETLLLYNKDMKNLSTSDESNEFISSYIKDNRDLVLSKLQSEDIVTMHMGSNAKQYALYITRFTTKLGTNLAVFVASAKLTLCKHEEEMLKGPIKSVLAILLK